MRRENIGNTGNAGARLAPAAAALRDATPAEPAKAPISDSEFEFIRRLALEHAGIAIAEYKRHMVYRRLGKRIRTLGMPDIATYCAYLQSSAFSGEVQSLINALTTNKTDFFREIHHFEHLATTALPNIVAALKRDRIRRIRLWSAGCSSGQEPYTAAMVLHESIPDLSKWDARILATDIDTEVIARARSGIYDTHEIASVPLQYRRKFVEQVAGSQGKSRIKEPVRSMVTFSPLNLHEHWPMQGPFDIVFCRNVVIYFDRAGQCRLFDRFADIMRSGAYLYVGHSESLYKVSNRYRLVGQSIYQKIS